MRWLRSPTAAALELESSAPPMDLDRPQGSSAQPLDLPQRTSPPSIPALDAASPLSLAQLAQSSEVCMEPDAHSLGTASESAVASNAESAVTVDQEDGTESAAEAEPAVAAASGLKSGSPTDISASVSPSAPADKPVQPDDEQSRVVISPQEHTTQAVAKDASAVTAVRPTEQSGQNADVQGERQVLGGGERQVGGGEGQGEGQVVGGDGGGERQVVRGGDSDTEGSQTEGVVPSTEEDLDTAMLELAQEVRYVALTSHQNQHIRRNTQ